jgi:hypothetical protein
MTAGGGGGGRLGSANGQWKKVSDSSVPIPRPVIDFSEPRNRVYIDQNSKRTTWQHPSLQPAAQPAQQQGLCVSLSVLVIGEWR